MDSLEAARNLFADGKFAEAFQTLDRARVDYDERISANVLRVELLEFIGRHGACRTLADRLLKSRELSSSQRAACEFALSRLDADDGDVESAIRHLQKSASLALLAKDLERACWAQLRLWLITADRAGRDAATPLFSDLRTNVTKLGSPRVTAALHIAVGELEGKCGLLGSAIWHTRLAQRLLTSAPHPWLEWWTENTLAAVSLVRGDFETGIVHCRRALHLADTCGAAAAQRSSFGNLGNLMCLVGQFDEAVEHFRQAIAILPSNGEYGSANRESLARIRLLQDRLGDCAELLEQIENSIQDPNDRKLYTYRYSSLTRVALLWRQKQPRSALAVVEAVTRFANDCGDDLLQARSRLIKAELLQEIGRMPESLELLSSVVLACINYPPDLYAQYERVLGRALATAGHLDAARAHFDRARRVYESIRSAPGLLELSRAWDEATTLRPLADRAASPRFDSMTAVPAAPVASAPDSAPAPAPVAVNAPQLLQTIAALMLHAGRPELLAREIVHLLVQTGCAVAAAALASADDGGVEILGVTPGANADQLRRNVRWRALVGSARERRVEIVAQPGADVEAHAALNAVRLLVSTVGEIEQSRADREERVSLWPMHDEDGEMGYAIANGRMRELMTLARRIANTTVSVLITGESGTGKEILARAIHHYSDRVQRPFIPFNCTAVPREMMDSQLFGYRRGAFTGADRDHPGVIRSARDGTLFLDEIGEMGLELQPKLLRFLESGEIFPLGESTPLAVTVRVVAATNSDLEQLVAEGRFREDLFYRLNVVRLRVPPLRERRDEIPSLVNEFVARAAAEFKKGDVRVSEETMEHLLLYRWPGNVRQLHNEIRRIVALAEPGSVLSPDVLSDEVANPVLKQAAQARGGGDRGELVMALHDKLVPAVSKLEREMIRLALHEHHGHVEAAAKSLGISRKGLYLKRQRLGL